VDQDKKFRLQLYGGGILLIIVLAAVVFGWYLEQREADERRSVVLRLGESVSKVCTVPFGLARNPLGGDGVYRVTPTRIEAPSFLAITVTGALTTVSTEQVVNQGPVTHYLSSVDYIVRASETAPAGKYQARIVFPAAETDAAWGQGYVDLTVEVR